jgi:Uma2 family endonuclease
MNETEVRTRHFSRLEYERLLDGGTLGPEERFELIGGHLIPRAPQRGGLAQADRTLPSRPDLVVEVAESSLTFDRREKASLYARARVEDYWIVNLVSRVLEVLRDPVTDPAAPYGWRYARTRILTGADVVFPVGAPLSRIPIADLLP